MLLATFLESLGTTVLSKGADQIFSNGATIPIIKSYSKNLVQRVTRRFRGDSRKDRDQETTESDTCLAISEAPDMSSEGPRMDLQYVSHCLRDWGSMLEVPRFRLCGEYGRTTLSQRLEVFLCIRRNVGRTGVIPGGSEFRWKD